MEEEANNYHDQHDVSTSEPVYTEQQQETVNSIQEQHKQYHDWLVQYVRNSAGIADGQEAQPPSGLDVSSLVSSIYGAASAYSYVTALKSWAEAVRTLERKQRDLGPSPSSAAAKAGGFAAFSSGLSVLKDQEAYTAAVHGAIEALGAALYAGEVAAYYAHAAIHAVPQLHAVSEAISSRMHECRYALYTRLNEDAASLLATCHWPPPLLPPASSQQPTANGGAGGPRSSIDASMAAASMAAGSQGDGTVGPPDAAASHGEGADAAVTGSAGSQPASAAIADWSGTTFAGFESLDQSTLAALLAVLACLTSLQQACERHAFAAITQQVAGGDAAGGTPSVQDPHTLLDHPVLWAAVALVAPLQAKLLAHFDPSQPAGDLRRPASWLYRIALRLVQEYTRHMAVLQPALAASGLGGACHMSVEWARAVRDAVKAVLRAARLPALVEAWERGETDAADLWAAQVEAAIEFEGELAPFLGGQLTGSSGAKSLDAVPDALLAGSVLGVLCEEGAGVWGVWLGVERTAALSRLQRVLDDAGAWQPTTDDDLAAVEPGWQREFNPPRLAEEVVGAVGAAVERSRLLPTAAAQKEYLDTVGGALLGRVQELLSTTLDQAASFSHIMSEAWAPRVGACVAAARYLHHTMCELLEGPALSRVHAEAAATAATAAADGATPAAATATDGGSPVKGCVTSQSRVGSPGPTGTWPSPGRSPSKGGLVGEVVVRHSFAPAAAAPPVLSAAVGALGATHREWCLRIARELATGFGRAAVAYRAAVDDAAAYPTHSGAAGTVTPALLPALVSLQAGLSRLSPALDGPSFRDIWRAVTVPANRFMFNYVATDARFSQQGAAQFAVDCAGLVAVFAPYTGRPGPHFRETLAAARLLTLPDAHAQEAVRRASACAVAGEPLARDPWLAELGVACLSAAQVVAVVERRL